MPHSALAASVTHVGLVSSHNEDHHASDPELGLWVIADGMGGHAAGEVASDLAVKTVLNSFRSGSNLKEAVADAHPVVLEAIAADPALEGMGTTVVAVHLNNRQYQVAWVGDSRCYHWSEEGLRQVTRDHSYLAFLLESGTVDAATAHRHPERKSLTHAIGVNERMRPGVATASGQLRSGECLLLCSDGLSDELDDKAIAAILATGAKAPELCRQLLDAALRQGGRDNITVTIIKGSQPENANTLMRKATVWWFGAGLVVAGALIWLLA